MLGLRLLLAESRPTRRRHPAPRPSPPPRRTSSSGGLLSDSSRHAVHELMSDFADEQWTRSKQEIRRTALGAMHAHPCPRAPLRCHTWKEGFERDVERTRTWLRVHRRAVPGAAHLHPGVLGQEVRFVLSQRRRPLQYRRGLPRHGVTCSAPPRVRAWARTGAGGAREELASSTRCCQHCSDASHVAVASSDER